MTILGKKLKSDYGNISKGCLMLSVELYAKTGRKYKPEALRAACYKKVGVRMALDIIQVIDFTLAELRPDIKNIKEEAI